MFLQLAQSDKVSDSIAPALNQSLGLSSQPVNPVPGPSGLHSHHSQWSKNTEILSRNLRSMSLGPGSAGSNDGNDSDADFADEMEESIMLDLVEIQT